MRYHPRFAIQYSSASREWLLGLDVWTTISGSGKHAPFICHHLQTDFCDILENVTI